MEKLNALIKPDMLLVDQVIRSDMHSDVALINQISNYIIGAGGKRIRPQLAILCGRICGYTGESLILHKMAAMIEYIHTATLLHDDVVDESGLRRGFKTANNVFGNSVSILVGDFIYTRAFQMMVESNSLKLLKIMADCTNRISEGEVRQLLNIGKTDLTEAEYFAIIDAKTAKLFEACASVAAIITKSSPQVENHLLGYARNLGIAFQIVDDVLDYMGDATQMGKNIGDDLTEGKITLPLIYSMNDPKLKDQIQIALSNPENIDVNNIINLVKQSGAIEYSKDQAHKHADLAIKELASFPDSPYKEAMLELANFAVARVT